MVTLPTHTIEAEEITTSTAHTASLLPLGQLRLGVCFSLSLTTVTLTLQVQGNGRHLNGHWGERETRERAEEKQHITVSN